MRLPAFPALAAVLLLASGAAGAVPVRGLYEASVPVPDQGAGAREPALRQALSAVLVKLVGQRPLPDPALALLPRATGLVQGYGYETAPGSRELRLKAQFDGRALEAALRAQALPVWGANRPSHLLWIALRDESGTRTVLDESGVNERAAAAVTAAGERGLPLLLPAPTGSERRRLEFNEIWDGRTDELMAVSGRYGANAVVVARIGREGSRWTGRWQLLDGKGLAEDWTVSGSSLDDVLVAGIDQLGDRQGSRLAAQSTMLQELRLDVRGVDALRDYGRVLNHVRGLSAVRQAQVETAAGDRLTLRLRVEGDREALTRALDSGSALRRDPDTGDGDALAYVLVH